MALSAGWEKQLYSASAEFQRMWSKNTNKEFNQRLSCSACQLAVGSVAAQGKKARSPDYQMDFLEDFCEVKIVDYGLLLGDTATETLIELSHPPRFASIQHPGVVHAEWMRDVFSEVCDKLMDNNSLVASISSRSFLSLNEQVCVKKLQLCAPTHLFSGFTAKELQNVIQKGGKAASKLLKGISQDHTNDFQDQSLLTHMMRCNACNATFTRLRSLIPPEEWNQGVPDKDKAKNLSGEDVEYLEELCEDESDWNDLGVIYDYVDDEALPRFSARAHQHLVVTSVPLSGFLRKMCKAFVGQYGHFLLEKTPSFQCYLSPFCRKVRQEDRELVEGEGAWFSDGLLFEEEVK